MPRSSRSEVPAGKVVASWQRDAVHVWGWDGVQSMAPFWLAVGVRGTYGASPPSSYGFHSSLDVVATSGERLRPASVRLDAVAGLGWLRAAKVESDSLTWFGTLATFAERVVSAGAVVPTITSRPEFIPGDLPSVVAEVH
jgi:hypothetical protein